MKLCQSCGEKNPDSSFVCDNCGGTLESISDIEAISDFKTIITPIYPPLADKIRNDIPFETANTGSKYIYALNALSILFLATGIISAIYNFYKAYQIKAPNYFSNTFKINSDAFLYNIRSIQRLLIYSGIGYLILGIILFIVLKSISHILANSIKSREYSYKTMNIIEHNNNKNL
jgi:hypothetical protein